MRTATGIKTLSTATMVVAVFTGLFFLPSNTEALRCSVSGHTVVFVNGILNNEDEAKETKEALEDKYLRYTKDRSVNFILAHNPSHVAGLGDLTQSYYQILGNSISNLDLKTILMQLHEDISTQKVLLVGHSQGTFYTNRIYEYLIENGLPESAVAVYNIATPANYVSGDGEYLTSANDNLIKKIEVWTAGLDMNQPLEANVLIPVNNPATKPLWRGHSLKDEYLAGGSVRIVSDINNALRSLRSRDGITNQGGCFNVPEKNLSFRLQKGGFAILDNGADALVMSGKAVNKSRIAVTKTIKEGFAGVGEKIDESFATTVKNVHAEEERRKRIIFNQGASVASALEQFDEEDPTVEEVFAEPVAEPEVVDFLPPAPDPIPVPAIVEEIIEEITPEVIVQEPVEIIQVEPEPVVEEPAFTNELYAIPEAAIGGGGGGGGGGGDTTPPDAPTITSPADFSSNFGTTTISFAGTAEANSQARASYSRSSGDVSSSSGADSDGNWSIGSLVFDQGTTTVSFTATDDSGNTSSATTVDVYVDTLPTLSSITSPTNGQIFSTSTVTFSGIATSSISSTLTISNTFNSSTTTSDTSGSWSMSLSGLSQGTTTVGFIASDNYSSSATTSVEIDVDITAPTLGTFSVVECDYSLNSSSCVAGGSPINISHISTSTDVSYYSIIKDSSIVATTTSTSSTLALSDGTYSIQVAVYDTAGNGATSTAQSIEVDSMPVVINEIAWGGTKSSADDEWIELYNTRSDTVQLSNLAITTSDGSPYISLSGTLSANSYYLIERDDDNTTSVDADLTTAFSEALSDSGEVLTLSHVIGTTATTTLDATPALSDCSGAWCGGLATTTPISMERVSSTVSGTTASNWKSNDTYYTTGTDSNGDKINGTPKSQNSVSIMTIGYYCTDATSTYVEGGYYIPTSGSCRYLSSGFSGNRYGLISRGELASSTEINGHSLGSNDDKLENSDAIPNPVQGENIIIMIFENHGGNDVTDFVNFLKDGSSNPPHLNYGILNWKYGTEP